MGSRPKWPMSAYRASPPVTTRNTAPSRKKPARAVGARRTAPRSAGPPPAAPPARAAMPRTPRTASSRNHTTITGPKTPPTRPVPRLWKANRPTRMAMAIGMIQASSAGAATFRPSTALSTEMAGVMVPSPYSSAAPKRPSTTSSRRGRPPSSSRAGWIRAINARMPPSPLLSARMTYDQVLHRDHQHQRPEDQRQHPQHVGGGEAHLERAVEALPQRVQGAGADVAEDHAQRGQRQDGQAAAAGRAAVGGRGFEAVLENLHGARLSFGIPGPISARTGAAAVKAACRAGGKRKPPGVAAGGLPMVAVTRLRSGFRRRRCRRPGRPGSPVVRKRWMLSAALRPWPMARITVAPPVTMSPAAKVSG